jgi:hypothetical protein
MSRTPHVTERPRDGQLRAHTCACGPWAAGLGIAGAASLEFSGACASTGAGRVLTAQGVVSAAGDGAGGTMLVALWRRVREQPSTALGSGFVVPATPIRGASQCEWTSEYHPRPVHTSAGLVLRPLPWRHGDADRMYSFMY